MYINLTSITLGLSLIDFCSFSEWSHSIRIIITNPCNPTHVYWTFLTASRASLAVLGIAFRRRHRRRQHFWKICCISELFWNMLFKLDQTWSNLIELDQNGLNWFKLAQTCSNLIKLDQNGINWFKLD